MHRSRSSTSSTTTREPCSPLSPCQWQPPLTWCESSSTPPPSTACPAQRAQRQRRDLHRRLPWRHTGMEIELATLGITFKHGKPYHPQTQGKVERYHRTLKNYLRKKPAVATSNRTPSPDRPLRPLSTTRNVPTPARGRPPMHAWRALDKATIEIDGQPVLANTKVRRRQHRQVRHRHPSLPVQAPPLSVGREHRGKRILILVC